MALLVLRFSVLSLVLAKYAINKFPAMLHSDVKEEILRAIFPSHTPAEVNLLISHLPKFIIIIIIIIIIVFIRVIDMQIYDKKAIYN